MKPLEPGICRRLPVRAAPVDDESAAGKVSDGEYETVAPRRSTRIGHIFLEGSENGCSEHFVRLVDGIAQMGFAQHVLVGNHDLAARAAVGGSVTVGPVTHSAVMAMVLMPDVSLVHAHDDEAGRAALLLRLTRSIPYVITRRNRQPLGRSPILRSIYRRAETVIASSAEAAAMVAEAGTHSRVVEIGALHSPDTAQQLASHVRIYRQAVDRLSVPTMLL